MKEVFVDIRRVWFVVHRVARENLSDLLDRPRHLRYVKRTY